MNENQPTPKILKYGTIQHILTHADRVKAGKTSTEKTRRRNILNARKEKRCRNCVLPCPFKQSNMRKDIDHKCSVPEQIYLTLRMAGEKNVIIPKLNQLFAEAEIAVKAQGTPQDQIKLVQAAIKLAEYVEPKDVQVNMDIDHRISIDQLQGFFRPPKELKVVEAKTETEGGKENG